MATLTLTTDRRRFSTVLLLAALFWCAALVAHPLFHLAAPGSDGDHCGVCLAYQSAQAAPTVASPAGAAVPGERVAAAALCLPPELPTVFLASRAPPTVVD